MSCRRDPVSKPQCLARSDLQACFSRPLDYMAWSPILPENVCANSPCASRWVRARLMCCASFSASACDGLRSALLPVVSLIGPLAISSITAAVVTESVFSLPGLGKLIVNGASNRDYTLVLGLVVLITVVTVVFNLLVDLAYALLDPKIRY